MDRKRASAQVATERLCSQYEAVVNAAQASGINLEPATLSPGDPVPMSIHERDAIVMHEDDLDLARQHGVAIDDTKRRERPRRVGPLTVVPISGETARQAIGRLNGIKSRMAAPNHLFSICPVNLCPADEPSPVPATTPPEPTPAQSDAGQGIRVRVIDTGLLNADDFAGYRDQHPWMFAVPEPTADGVKVIFEGPFIKEYAGHGTFITGLLKCVAPAADITVSNRLQMAGAIMEDDLANALLAALDQQPPPNIISLSAGATTLDGTSPACLDLVRDRLRDSDQTVLVAAAGNDGDGEELFWPAAYASELPPGKVVAVGALRRDGAGRACFSNFGPFVTVYAPGERLANAFVSGRYRYFDPPSQTCDYYPSAAFPAGPLYTPCTCISGPPQHSEVQFEAMARWSGTSFATPLVAGAVAAYMTDHHETNAQRAARDLLEKGTTQITDVDGRTLTVLTPHATADRR